MHFLKLQHDLNLSRYHAKIKWTDSLQNFPQEAWNATTTKTHAIIESLKIRSRPSKQARAGNMYRGSQKQFSPIYLFVK